MRILRSAVVNLGLIFVLFLAASAQTLSQRQGYAPGKCGIFQGDILVIPKLDAATQKQLNSWLAAGDCKNLKAFADSREYYGNVKAGAKLPRTPAGWSLDYLTWPELKRLTSILMALGGSAEFVPALTPTDVQFLINECVVERADAEVIPRLTVDTQSNILEWIRVKDCKKLTPFKNTRTYYRSLKMGERMPMPPPGWDFEYLTADEFLRYSDMLDKAPL